MPRRKFIDKKTATTFQLLHRAQNDPLIHDTDASQFVFAEVQPSSTSRRSAANTSSIRENVLGHKSSFGHAGNERSDLEVEFGLDFKDNEGEAAQHGIYFDDTKYDYMQHMRDLGSAAGDAVWVEAPNAPKSKGKQKQSLDDRLRDIMLDDSISQGGSQASGVSTATHLASDVFDPSMLPSDYAKKVSYQDQQNIPDALAGFQPDMDPRLREVLEALEDDVYVDEEEHGDFFERLTGEDIEWDDNLWDEENSENGAPLYVDDAGWETDDTIKPHQETRTTGKEKAQGGTVLEDGYTNNSLPAPGEAPADREDTEWQSEFARFKVSGKPPTRGLQEGQNPYHLQSTITGASSLLSTGRKKKRKGALTSTSGYSMSSSVLRRTETMTVLDERFEKIAEEYADDHSLEDDISLNSGVSGISSVSGVSNGTGLSGTGIMRSDFDSLVDDFLAGHSTSGKSKRRVKRGTQQTGMQQLDEIREGLGKPRVGKAQVA